MENGKWKIAGKKMHNLPLRRQPLSFKVEHDRHAAVNGALGQSALPVQGKRGSKGFFPFLHFPFSIFNFQLKELQTTGFNVFLIVA